MMRPDKQTILTLYVSAHAWEMDLIMRAARRLPLYDSRMVPLEL
jgi:hypothetical protein